MAKKDENKVTVPSGTFDAEGVGTFKFRLPLFIVPGKNGNQPIKAEDALTDSEILAYLVKSKSSVIEKVTKEEEEA